MNKLYTHFITHQPFSQLILCTDNYTYQPMQSLKKSLPIRSDFFNPPPSPAHSRTSIQIHCNQSHKLCNGPTKYLKSYKLYIAPLSYQFNTVSHRVISVITENLPSYHFVFKFVNICHALKTKFPEPAAKHCFLIEQFCVFLSIILQFKNNRTKQQIKYCILISKKKKPQLPQSLIDKKILCLQYLRLSMVFLT